MSTNNKKQLFNLIYNENAQSITRLCYMYLKNIELAQDAAQETFMKAYKKLSSFKGKSDINTWLTAIAINTCKSFMRKNPFGKIVPLDEAIEIASEENDKETAISVSDAVKSLPAKLRVVILLKYYRDLKTNDIAKVLKLPTSTINYRLSEAKRMLKEKLKEDFDDD